MVEKVEKRSGQIVDFNQKKISKAIHQAITATGQGDGEKAKEISDKVVEILNEEYDGETPHVENIQDIIEKVLVAEDLFETAKAYILYREQRRKTRETAQGIDETIEMVDDYIKELDWQVRENANMSYSMQGLNHYVVSAVTKEYWLNRIYPQEIRDAVREGKFHIHDLDTLATYCCGWDLYSLLQKGFRGVPGKVESKPPKHFGAALGQLVNFLYTLQGESAGAQAVSSFDTLLAPFIRYDNLSYREVKQNMQSFIFNCAIPTRVGFQSPFTNVTLDINPPKDLADQPVIIGGKAQDETYGDFQEEMNMINKAFFECMIEGDAKGRPFTFPIPTINITDDSDWSNPTLDPMWEATAKYGLPYFSNFVSSDMSPDDVRSMCCRLRLDNKELHKRGGGLFGSNPLTGSIGVVTINLPRMGYLSETKEELKEKIGEAMDLAKESLEIKRKVIENFIEKGLYPYSKFYLAEIKKMRGEYYANHFSTIGLIGMNECLLNFIGKNIGSDKGQDLALEIMEFMRKKLRDYQEETDNLYNLEATPGEGTSYRLALKDKKEFPDIITAGKEGTPYYTNSTQLPVGYTNDIFEELDLQNDLQCKYTGGTVDHLFLGEKISNIENAKKLIKTAFENYSLPYITLTPTFSICPQHGYIPGEHFDCPKCVVKQPCEVYSRIVGYLRPVQQWNDGKQQEFKERETFDVEGEKEEKKEEQKAKLIND